MPEPTPLPHTWLPTVDPRPETCACGQDLDHASGTHCPRCGVHRGAHRATAA